MEITYPLGLVGFIAVFVLLNGAKSENMNVNPEFRTVIQPGIANCGEWPKSKLLMAWVFHKYGKLSGRWNNAFYTKHSTLEISVLWSWRISCKT